MSVVVGDRFGDWTVVALCPERPSRVLVTCACGATAGAARVVRTLESGASGGCSVCAPTRTRKPCGDRVAVGDQHGHWTVVKAAVKRIGSSTYHVCRCKCGARKTISTGNLRNSLSRMCRKCGSAEAWKSRGGHRLSGTQMYRLHKAIVTRCHSTKARAFANYGARGITVAAEWRGRGGFERFNEYILSALGPRPSKLHSLDRVDNESGYRPGNVRWATHAQQMRNTRRTRLLVVGGESLTMSEAGARIGITRQGIHQRLAWGWTPVEAATIPKGETPARLAGTRSGRGGRRIKWDGVVATITEWSRLADLAPETIVGRINAGWPMDRVMTEPKHTPVTRWRGAAQEAAE